MARTKLLQEIENGKKTRFTIIFLIKKENDNECKNCFRGRISLNRYVSILARYCWLCELRTPPWNLADDEFIGSLLAAGLVNKQVVVVAEVEVVAKMPVAG
jgi:hypothetical protein